MGFIEKYLEARESEKFVIDKDIILKCFGILIFILLISGYLTISYFHSLNINKKMFYVYFFHYHDPNSTGFILPFIYITLIIFSFILSIIFGLLFFKLKNKSKSLLNYWIIIQFIITEYFVINMYSLEPIQDHTLWSFIDSLILWNLVFNIFVPILPILILIKIFKK